MPKSLPNRALLAVLAAWMAAVAVGVAQRRDVFVLSRDHPAIAYSTGAIDNAVTRLNDAAASRARHAWRSQPTTAICRRCSRRSASRRLRRRWSSPRPAFRRTASTCTTRARCSSTTPWPWAGCAAARCWRWRCRIRGRARVFYALEQKAAEAPQLVRNNQCLACHLTWETLGVPGFMTTSMYPLPDDPNAYANGFTTIHGSPLEQRWGGWWVTGQHRRRAAHGQRAGDAGGQGQGAAQSPARRWRRWRASSTCKGYPSNVERRGGAAGAEPPDADAQPPDPRRVGSARRRGRAQRRRRRAGGRSGRGSGQLHAVPRRGAARRSGEGARRVRRVVRRAGPARRQGPVAARVRSHPAAVQVPVQLPDLFRGVRQPARKRQARGLRAAVGRAQRQGRAGTGPARDCPGRSAGRSSRSCARPSPTFPSPSADYASSDTDHVGAGDRAGVPDRRGHRARAPRRGSTPIAPTPRA